MVAMYQKLSFLDFILFYNSKNRHLEFLNLSPQGLISNSGYFSYTTGKYNSISCALIMDTAVQIVFISGKVICYLQGLKPPLKKCNLHHIFKRYSLIHKLEHANLKKMANLYYCYEKCTHLVSF